MDNTGFKIFTWSLKFIIGIGIMVYAAFVEVNLWNWFIKPLSPQVIDLTVLNMIGINLFMGVFTFSTTKIENQMEKEALITDPVDKLVNYLQVVFIYAVVMAFMWGFAYIFHLMYG